MSKNLHHAGYIGYCLSLAYRGIIMKTKSFYAWTIDWFLLLAYLLTYMVIGCLLFTSRCHDSLPVKWRRMDLSRVFPICMCNVCACREFEVFAYH